MAFFKRKSWNADFCFPRLHECHMHPDLQQFSLQATRNIITIFLKQWALSGFPIIVSSPSFVISEAFIALCISLKLCVKWGVFLGTVSILSAAHWSARHACWVGQTVSQASQMEVRLSNIRWHNGGPYSSETNRMISYS